MCFGSQYTIVGLWPALRLLPEAQARFEQDRSGACRCLATISPGPRALSTVLGVHTPPPGSLPNALNKQAYWQACQGWGGVAPLVGRGSFFSCREAILPACIAGLGWWVRRKLLRAGLGKSVILLEKSLSTPPPSHRDSQGSPDPGNATASCSLSAWAYTHYRVGSRVRNRWNHRPRLRTCHLETVSSRPEAGGCLAVSYGKWDKLDRPCSARASLVGIVLGCSLI